MSQRLQEQIELVLLRSLVERKETCRKAAEHVVAFLNRQESAESYARDEAMGRTI